MGQAFCLSNLSRFHFLFKRDLEIEVLLLSQQFQEIEMEFLLKKRVK